MLCYCILKCLHSLHSLNHKNLSFPWIYDIFNFFFFWVFVSDDFTLSPLGIRRILKRLNKVWLHFSWNSSDLHFCQCLKKCIMVSTKILSSTVVNIYLNLLWCNSTHKAMAKYLVFFVGWMLCDIQGTIKHTSWAQNTSTPSTSRCFSGPHDSASTAVMTRHHKSSHLLLEVVTIVSFSQRCVFVSVCMMQWVSSQPFPQIS